MTIERELREQRQMLESIVQHLGIKDPVYNSTAIMVSACGQYRITLAVGHKPFVEPLPVPSADQAG